MPDEQSKSVLDGVPVKITEDTKDGLLARTYKQIEETQRKIEEIKNNRLLEIVGYCPQCGAPIYGDKKVGLNEAPTVRYSCYCWRKAGIVSQQYETK